MFARAIPGLAFLLSTVVSAGPSPRPSPVAHGSQPRTWHVVTHEHVDLWLHGFAMLTSDTGKVTFFERGYKQAMRTLKQQRNVVTNLDANQKELSQRFATSPQLANAQFVAMYFGSMQELSNAMDAFIRTDGEPRRVGDRTLQQQVALLAANFPSPADHAWARLFWQSLQDEHTKFYHAYWTAEQQARSATFAQVNQLWTSTYYPRLSRFLNNTQQSGGEFVLSLTLGGEGRTVSGDKQSNMIATIFPRSADSASLALFGFVHEAAAQLVNDAIKDNTTPAQARSGEAERFVGVGAVRGGALLLQKTLPDLVPGYMRFYLAQIRQPPPAGDPRVAFEAAFPLPEAIVTAVSKSIDGALSGI